MFHIRGIPVFENSLVPKEMPVLQINPAVPMTDAFREEMNKWLLETFGTKRAVLSFNGKLFIHPENFLALLGNEATIYERNETSI